MNPWEDINTFALIITILLSLIIQVVYYCTPDENLRDIFRLDDRVKNFTYAVILKRIYAFFNCAYFIVIVLFFFNPKYFYLFTTFGVIIQYYIFKIIFYKYCC